MELPCALEVALETGALLYAFGMLAHVCDVHLVPALETLCVRWHLREDVAGASVLAFGSAAPEIVINVVTNIKSAQVAAQGGYDPSSALGISAILGSAAIAFTVIPAVCILLAPPEIERFSLKRRPLLRDVGFYVIALCALIAILADNEIGAVESFALLFVYLLYLLAIAFSPAIRHYYRTSILGKPVKVRDHFVTGMPGAQQLDAPKCAGTPDATPAAGSTMTVALLGGDERPAAASHVAGSSGESSSVPVTEAEEEEDETDEEAGATDAAGSALPCCTLGCHGACRALSRARRRGPLATASAACGVLLEPGRCVLRWTVPDAARGQPWEEWYPLAFALSLVWIAALSLLVASIAQRWVELSQLPIQLFGFLLIAGGAEIPDTIQSLMIARRGYGSMAVASCLGSQNINVLVGLGA